MPAPRIRGDYDSLAQAAQIFSRQASSAQQMVRRVQNQTETLRGGDWIGAGATAFYREMDSQVLPSLRRLAAAMNSAEQVTQRIIQILRDAEAEAARVLGAQGAGGLAALAAGLAGAAAAGGDGSGPLADWQAANPLLARDPRELFSDSNMRGLIGSRFQGAGSELGEVMTGLMNNPQGDELDQFIERLSEIRGRPAEELRIEYERFQEVQAQRDANNPEAPEALSGGGHPSFMGSNTQMRYGSVVGDAFGIDPVFGAMLNPTGGLVGPGNWAIAGNDTAVGYHGVVHDAAGYLHNYHQVGPGYDYLGTEGRDTSSPLSGQRDGIAYWRQATGGPSPISAPAEWVMRGVVGGIDLGGDLLQSQWNAF
jgi:WXG100 family type VII secretion target